MEAARAATVERPPLWPLDRTRRQLSPGSGQVIPAHTQPEAPAPSTCQLTLTAPSPAPHPPHRAGWADGLDPGNAARRALRDEAQAAEPQVQPAPLSATLSAPRVPSVTRPEASPQGRGRPTMRLGLSQPQLVPTFQRPFWHPGQGISSERGPLPSSTVGGGQQLKPRTQQNLTSTHARSSFCPPRPHRTATERTRSEHGLRCLEFGHCTFVRRLPPAGLTVQLTSLG